MLAQGAQARGGPGKECLCPACQCSTQHTCGWVPQSLVSPWFVTFPPTTVLCGIDTLPRTVQDLTGALLQPSPIQRLSLLGRSPRPQHLVCRPSQVGTGQNGHSCSAAPSRPGILVTTAALIAFSSSLLPGLSAC